jgi:putative oxidoreductase
VDRSQRRVRRAVKTAKREAKIAAVTATAARRLPGGK